MVRPEFDVLTLEATAAVAAAAPDEEEADKLDIVCQQIHLLFCAILLVSLSCDTSQPLD